MQPTNNQQPKTQKAFTLIELLVVIAIVGILAGLAVVSMSGATDRARAVKAQNFAASIQHSMATSLAGEWNFDGQNANDSSGNNNNGTVSGGAVYSTSTPAGNGITGQYSLDLNGTNGYINLGTIFNDDLPSVPATISLWVKGSFANGSQVILGHYASKIGLGFYVSGGNNYFIVRVGDVAQAKPIFNVGNAFINDAWNHIAVTYDSSENSTFWLNGSQITTTGANNYWTWASDEMNIGRRPTGTYLKGSIDEVRIYKSVISASQAREDYLAGLNKLLADSQITQQDYQQRLADLNSIYATKE